MKSQDEMMHDLIIEMLAQEEGEAFSDYFELLESASKFRKKEGWNVIRPLQIFVVKEPYTNRLGFCRIEGEANSHYTFTIYDGIESFSEYISYVQASLQNADEFISTRNYLRTSGFTVSFENRTDLSKEDYEIIKENGFSFRGKLQWPVIRRIVSGAQPQMVRSVEDLNFLSYCLDITNDVVQDIKEGSVSLPTRQGELLMVTTDEMDLVYSILTTNALDQIQMQPIPVKDEILKHRLKKLPLKNEVFELECLFLPTVVAVSNMQQEVSYHYPCMCTLVNRQTGTALAPLMEQTEELIKEKLINWLAKNLINQGYRPKVVELSDEKLATWLVNFFETFEMKIRFTYSQPQTKAFIDGLIKDSFM